MTLWHLKVCYQWMFFYSSYFRKKNKKKQFTRDNACLEMHFLKTFILMVTMIKHVETSPKAFYACQWLTKPPSIMTFLNKVENSLVTHKTMFFTKNVEKCLKHSFIWWKFAKFWTFLCLFFIPTKWVLNKKCFISMHLTPLLIFKRSHNKGGGQVHKCTKTPNFRRRLRRVD